MRLTTRILVVGPDGAGKSTVLDGVIESMERTGLRVGRVHFDPSNRDESNPAVAVTDPHENVPRSAPLQVVAVTKRWLQYARASSGHGRLSRRRADVIFQERGWHDQVVDPTRYRMTRVGQVAARVLGPFTLRYDGVLQLHGDAAAIVQRKPELSETEIKRQIDMWSVLLRNRRNVTMIDTVSQTIANAVLECESEVRQLRAARIRRALSPVLATPRRLQMMATGGNTEMVDALYSPLSREGRLARKLPVLRGLSSARHHEDSARVGAVAAEIGVSADYLATIRSMGRPQAIVAVLRDNSLAEFMRLRWGRLGTNDVEASVIDAVQDINGVRVPVVLGLETVGEVSVLRMSAVGEVGYRQTFLPELALNVSVALRWARGGQGITHGDFTLWNLFDLSEPTLIDWEKGSLKFWPGEDLLYYLRHQTGIDDVLSVEEVLDQYQDLFARYADRCELNLAAITADLRANVAGARR